MIWFFCIPVFLLLLICWLLISPLVAEVDTRIPGAGLRWISIGNMRIWHEEEWWLSFQLFFYRKTMRLAEMKSYTRKRKNTGMKNKPPERIKMGRLIKKMIRVIKTFRITEWKLSIDTNDYCLNAKMYPLSFITPALQHLHINFSDENYLLLKIRNRPWKMIYAFFR